MSRRPLVHASVIVAAWIAVAAAPSPGMAATDSTAAVADSAYLRDVGDLVRDVLGRPPSPRVVIVPRPGLSLTVLPSFGYNASAGFTVGATMIVSGWLGDPTTTRISNGSVGTSYSTNKQFTVYFKGDALLPRDGWALKWDWRYLDTSQPTFGLGPTTDEQTEYPMDFVLYRLSQAAYKRIGRSSTYVGMGYHFDLYDRIHDERAELGEATPFSVYSGGTPEHTQSSGFSLGAVVDTRDHPSNASRGIYWNLSLRSNLHALGSDVDHHSLWSDFRAHTKLPRGGRHVLAVWNWVWVTSGSTPYLDLPAIGWDTYGRSGRGYLQGRIRGPQLGYLELEYRLRLTQHDMWGAVGFFSLTSASPDDGVFEAVDPAYGGGIRLKFNKRTKTNLAVDFGSAPRGKTRLFLGLQETF